MNFKEAFETLCNNTLSEYDRCKEESQYVTGDVEEATKLEGELRFADKVQKLLDAQDDDTGPAAPTPFVGETDHEL